MIHKDNATSLSYENLLGNLKDGEIGSKVKKQIFDDFFAKYNPEKDFYESFYFNRGGIFNQDNLVDTNFNILAT